MRWAIGEPPRHEDWQRLWGLLPRRSRSHPHRMHASPASGRMRWGIDEAPGVFVLRRRVASRPTTYKGPCGGSGRRPPHCTDPGTNTGLGGRCLHLLWLLGSSTAVDLCGIAPDGPLARAWLEAGPRARGARRPLYSSAVDVAVGRCVQGVRRDVRAGRGGTAAGAVCGASCGAFGGAAGKKATHSWNLMLSAVSKRLSVASMIKSKWRLRDTWGPCVGGGPGWCS